MKIKKGFVLRKVGGENIVVPVGEMSKSLHGMIKLNESCGFLCNFFLKEQSEEEAVAALLGEYEVSREEAERDVERFAEILRSNAFAE